MRYTVSLRYNTSFKRLYAKGKQAAGPLLAVYMRRNGKSENRLGITVSPKVGNAVIRNRVRRRIKESYRINEGLFKKGFDIVVVARVRAAEAPFSALQKSLLGLAAALGLRCDVS